MAGASTLRFPHSPLDDFVNDVGFGGVLWTGFGLFSRPNFPHPSNQSAPEVFLRSCRKTPQAEDDHFRASLRQRADSPRPHCRRLLPADIHVRHLRSMGEDVLWICGSDEHGAAITLRAKGGRPPRHRGHVPRGDAKAFWASTSASTTTAARPRPSTTKWRRISSSPCSTRAGLR